MSEHSCEDAPKCPYCDYIDDAMDEAYYFNEGTTEWDCPDCDKAYSIEIYHRGYLYSSKPKEQP